ncbi:MAG: response regulator [Candidatus Aminicenantes bacterium]|nr:response regulator [Candidatus Aminicenantes bacterium]
MKGHPIIILLVEDDLAHAEIVRRNLKDFRVANEIVHIEDGQAALDYLTHKGAYADPQASPRPHLILLDLRLPKVDGLEVLRRIKEDEDLKSIPTVVLTTSNTELDMTKAYENGAGSYLVKPVDFEKFTKLLDAFGFYWLAWNRYPD